MYNDENEGERRRGPRETGGERRERQRRRGESPRGREGGEKETDRQTDRQAGSQTNRQRQKQAETGRDGDLADDLNILICSFFVNWRRLHLYFSS